MFFSYVWLVLFVLESIVLDRNIEFLYNLLEKEIGIFRGELICLGLGNLVV